MKRRILPTLLLLGLLLAIPAGVSAQSYSFSVPVEQVEVYWNADGSLTIDYTFVFDNDSGADAIDYIDVGVPNANYDLGGVTADINGGMITDIQKSPYVDPGVALGLRPAQHPPRPARNGARAYRPGDRSLVPRRQRFELRQRGFLAHLVRFLLRARDPPT